LYVLIVLFSCHIAVVVLFMQINYYNY